MAFERALICPKCGATMNHHANKIINNFESAEAPSSDSKMYEFHLCPRCGYSTSCSAE